MVLVKSPGLGRSACRPVTICRCASSLRWKLAQRHVRDQQARPDPNNDGVLRGNNVITFVPDKSVTKLEIGDRIELTAAQFERLARAFFAEIEAKFG